MRARVGALIFPLATFLAGASPAAQDVAPQDVALLKDLTSVIMLLDMPCGQVVGAKRKTDTDHIASCENGSHYRIFVNAGGRVVAQKQ